MPERKVASTGDRTHNHESDALTTEPPVRDPVEFGHHGLWVRPEWVTRLLHIAKVYRNTTILTRISNHR